MKLFRHLCRTSLLLVVLAAPAVAQDAGQPSRNAFAARFKEAEKHKASAVVGKDGWLFLAADFRFLSLGKFWGDAAGKASRSPKPENADPIPAILDFQKQLKARGIELLLVPVPPKAALSLDKVPIASDTPAALAPLAQFYEELKAQGIDVLDLAPALGLVPAPENAFCRTDTHWSGAGCLVAAKAIAEHLKGKITFPQTKTPTFTSEWVESEIEGDLGPLLAKGDPKPAREKLRLRQVKAGNGAVQADPSSPLLLMGDSHTLVFHDFAGERAGLLDQLALEMGGAPDLIGTRGSGSTAVRINLYRKSIKDPEYLAKKKIVVWCFTAREFTESDQGWAKVPISK